MYFAGEIYSTPCPYDSSLFYCYKTRPVDQIFILTTAGLTENSYKGYRLHFADNLTEKLMYKNSFLIKQYFLSEDAYYFWMNLRKNDQESGGMFDRQPALVRSNITNTANPDEIVSGYFGVSSVRTKRIILSDVEGLSLDTESLFFKAYNLSNRQLKAANWSRVLYVEIITPEGKSVFQGKYRYNTTGACGKIIIPGDILTGNYHLRAYTKWIRNFSAYKYSHKIIQIINPYHAELLKHQSGSAILREKYSWDSLRTPGLSVLTDKTVYQRREKVLMTAQIADHLMNPGSFYISVIRSGTVIGYPCHIPQAEEGQFQAEFIPETRSVTLTGKVINQTDSSPIHFMNISLSMINSAKSTFATLTNEDGHLYFSLPEFTGETEIYISSVHRENEPDPVILVDNDFCSKEIKLPFVLFSQNNEDHYQSLLGCTSEKTGK